ncbi:MAG: hypothetical protein AB7G93_09420 [Bdellovibrionales bacterium]
MKKVREDEIVDRFPVCSVCLEQISPDQLECCGESCANAIMVVLLQEGIAYKLDEIEVVNG